MNVFVASSGVARVAANVERTVGLAEPRSWPVACLEELACGRFRPPTWWFLASKAPPHQGLKGGEELTLHSVSACTSAEGLLSFPFRSTAVTS